MANQVQIPGVKTDSDALNQVQQNINKVLRNFTNQVLDLQEQVAQMMIIGEIKFANLTLAQFQVFAGTDWILANGQSAVGTTYANLTGNTTVPNISVTGTTAFIKVN